MFFIPVLQFHPRGSGLGIGNVASRVLFGNPKPLILNPQP